MASDSGRAAFTLIELLVVVAITSVLISLLLPGLRGARDSARGVACASNQRQMGLAWAMYANTFADRAMPLAYWETPDLVDGRQVFWWGTYAGKNTPPDPSRGFLTQYLDSPLAARSVLECPSQPWGSYIAQGPRQANGEGWFTSTYGYNGYYLSPAKTPGWGSTIGFRPWIRLSDIQSPTTLSVFADAMLPYDTPVSTALLDPPLLYNTGGTWEFNAYATLRARHAQAANSFKADGHVQRMRAEPVHESLALRESAWLEQQMLMHVPDWTEWR